MAYDEALADRVRAEGMVLVAPEGVETEEQLGAWVARGSDVARSLPPK